MAPGDVERLRQFSRAGTKPADVLHSAAGLHQEETAPWFEGANQNETAAFCAFHQQIQHPMDAIIHININGAGAVSLHEGACARPGKGMAGFVIQSEIRFHFDHDPGTFSPHQFRADELARANQRVALKKSARQKRRFRHYVTVPRPLRFVINRQRNTALDRFSVAKRRNE